MQFVDRNQVEAEIVGFDPFADVALLKVDPEGLDIDPIELGSLEEVEAGDPVAAIGSPFGERQSLSVGVVSATERAIPSLTEFRIGGAIQTDASINPGNSGGPLLDAEGRVIGINQQIDTTSGGNQGVGFAVPIDLATRPSTSSATTGPSTTRSWASARAPFTPSWPSASTSTPRRGRWSSASSPTAPRRTAGIEEGRPAGSPSRATRSASGAT